MPILRTLARDFQFLFPLTDNGQERFHWFVLTLKAILVPITVSRTSNLLRAIETLFGVRIAQWRYYTFMASVKLPWDSLWEALWRAIPSPLVAGRLVLALEDSINPKTGKHIFACQRTFDHAAKTNQRRWPWAQTIVTVGLLKPVHGRWSCIPLAFGFYLRRQTLGAGCVRLRRKALVFADKFTQAVALIARLGAFFAQAPVLVVTDSWFGNNGLFTPRTQKVILVPGGTSILRWGWRRVAGAWSRGVDWDRVADDDGIVGDQNFLDQQANDALAFMDVKRLSTRAQAREKGRQAFSQAQGGGVFGRLFGDRTQLRFRPLLAAPKVRHAAAQLIQR
jgi:hypothetical protein